MSDTISRQAAIDAIKRVIWDKYIAKDAIDTVCNIPSAQPEITHCSECIHWKHSLARKSYCEVHDWMSKAEDFCSFAERG